MSILTPVSWGELLDKISILEIKSERISSPSALININRELAELTAVRNSKLDDFSKVQGLADEIKDINEQLWDIEDDIRDCERAKAFGEKFIKLARSVYITNDKRAEIKRRINKALGSELTEEKSYAEY